MEGKMVVPLLVAASCWLAAEAGGGGAAADSSKGIRGGVLSGPRMPGFLYRRTIGRCTPQYWSSGRERWPNIVPKDSSVAKVFGARLLERFEPGLTVMEATQRDDDVGGNAFSKLVKQSSAALLNAYARPGFPYTAWEIKSLVLEALISEEAADSQAEQFKQANHECH